jgi:hypothetical protein
VGGIRSSVLATGRSAVELGTHSQGDPERGSAEGASHESRLETVKVSAFGRSDAAREQCNRRRNTVRPVSPLPPRSE